MVDHHRYFYLGLPMDEKDPETVVVFEPVTLHGDRLGGNALYADGGTRWHNEEKLQAALLKTTARLSRRK
jgi:prepilin-type processing-associated H-X9-DG protein